MIKTEKTFPDKANDSPNAKCSSNSATNEATIDIIKTADCLKHVVDQL